MPYIGRGIETLSDRVVLDSLTASATASYTLQLNSVNFVPSSASSLTVSLNGVIQKPDSSYTVSGSTLTFSSALTSSDSIDFIIAERGITLQTPSAGSVGTSQLASNAVDLTSKVTGTLPIANGGIGSTTLSGAGIVNTPSFQAYLGSAQSIGVNTTTTVAIDTEEFDTDSAFNTSNYRFTVPSGKAGKYFFYGGITMANFFAYAVAEIAKNGSAIRRGVAVRNDASGVTVNALADLSEGDYITLSAYQDQSGQVLQSNSNFTYFGGFKLL